MTNLEQLARTETGQKAIDWCLGALKVLAGATLLALSVSYEHHEIKQWADLGNAISTATLAAVGVTITWLLVPSPSSQASERKLRALEQDHIDLQVEHAALKAQVQPPANPTSAK